MWDFSHSVLSSTKVYVKPHGIKSIKEDYISRAGPGSAEVTNEP